MIDYTQEQLGLIRRTCAPQASDDDFARFIYQCQRTGLDPLARQIYAVSRTDRKTHKIVTAIMVSIDGFRLIAERTGHYAGQLGPWWTGDGKTWTDCWVSDKPPLAAKISVLRNDFKEPLTAVARWDAYAQTVMRDGKRVLTPMWLKMGDLMIGKTAESLGLRRAFPAELSGLYTGDEMAQASNGRDDPPPEPEHAQEPVRAPTAAPAAAPESINAQRVEAWTNAIQGASNMEELSAVGKMIAHPDCDLTSAEKPVVRDAYRKRMEELQA